MLLWLARVLLEDAGNSITATMIDNCGNTIGVCDACITMNSSKPYWNGESCMSCAIGTESERPFLDDKKCVSECSNGQSVSVDDTTCVASCENGYMLVNSYEIVHKKCKENLWCNSEG